MKHLLPLCLLFSMKLEVYESFRIVRYAAVS